MLSRFLRELQYLFYRWRHPKRHQFFAEPHYFIDAGYIAIGRNYEKNHRQSRTFNERESRTDMRELDFAHTLLLGVIASVLENNNGKKIPTSDEVISRRFVITAAIIQGIFLCERAILQGEYLQAGALIRQEYEALTLLSEIREKRRKDGVQANAKYAPWKGSRHYGELSSFAHLSDHRVLDSLIGYNTSWGDFAATVPQYQKVNGSRMYARHIAYLLGLLEELRALYKEMYNYECSQREIEVIDNAFSILVKHGVFKTPTSKN